MDTACIVLGSFLLIQMALILVTLNPVYDVRKIATYLNDIAKSHRTLYFFTLAIYFTFVIYLGMYTPLRNISELISDKIISDYDKLVTLRRIEKNYVIAGFSLFLFVVQYGVKFLVSFTASLLDNLTSNDPLCSMSEKKGSLFTENILPNLLRVKRSVSYENILFSNELREQLKGMLLKNADDLHKTYFPHNFENNNMSI
ncbi:unnamed protein product [Leptidea sinapis]|uniref:Uncharacterized protein n=1 Tax=Leptidea sinapis TaxID=189913 RepID=A0A5E4QZA2_9NEOP|nr:unnamed protein product [Leptidea sinapis]